jgi:hypothetical protein
MDARSRLIFSSPHNHRSENLKSYISSNHLHIAQVIRDQGSLRWAPVFGDILQPYSATSDECATGQITHTESCGIAHVIIMAVNVMNRTRMRATETIFSRYLKNWSKWEMKSGHMLDRNFTEPKNEMKRCVQRMNRIRISREIMIYMVCEKINVGRNTKKWVKNCWIPTAWIGGENKELLKRTRYVESAFWWCKMHLFWEGSATVQRISWR